MGSGERGLLRKKRGREREKQENGGNFLWGDMDGDLEKGSIRERRGNVWEDWEEGKSFIEVEMCWDEARVDEWFHTGKPDIEMDIYVCINININIFILI